MLCRFTVRSREKSAANAKVMLLGMKRLSSYPPRTKDPNVGSARYDAPAVYPHDKLGIRLWFFKLLKKLGFGSFIIVASSWLEKLNGIGLRPRNPSQ